MAQRLGRTPSSIAMKLVNFASLDPAHRARGVKGLGGCSRADEEMWNEFRERWDQMMILSETKLHEFPAPINDRPAARNQEYVPDSCATQAEATVMVRTVQGVFRKLVLAAYNSICCVSEIPIPELLVASHILPWSAFPEQRLNPRNGLCLAVHFDKAFDRGLITFDRCNRLLLSTTLKRYLPNETIRLEFAAREGQPLRCPDRFPPDADYLTYHQEHIFHEQS